MSRLAAVLLPVLLLSGCMNDDGGGSAHWVTAVLLDNGSAPAADSAGWRVLFSREDGAAGLYLYDYNFGSVRHIRVGADLVTRTDYAWAHHGDRVCVSTPADGIYVCNAVDSTDQLHVWSIGAHPRFLPGDSLIVCAGPEDGSANQGVRIMALDGSLRQQLTTFGSSPEPSPDGHKVAFLALSGSSLGRTLIVYNRVTQIFDTLGQQVLSYAWLGDSEMMAYEGQDSLRSGIYLAALGNPIPVRLADGTHPSSWPHSNDFVFATAEEGVSTGIRLRLANGTIESVTDFGSAPRMIDPFRLLFQSAGSLHQAAYFIPL
ncbi:hypothetical protein HZB60_08940 [candidate division KSB1 bacterium]|nr:hypothetical protein [candidate division KSB1 bacterium]